MPKYKIIEEPEGEHILRLVTTKQRKTIPTGEEYEVTILPEIDGYVQPRTYYIRLMATREEVEEAGMGDFKDEHDNIRESIRVWLLNKKVPATIKTIQYI